MRQEGGMSDAMKPAQVPDLREAVRRARLDDADRTAALAELRSADHIRLEILSDALAPIFAQVPAGVELFDHGLVAGEHPRLHVDILAYVEMAADKRRYRFVQDARWGQRVIAETDDIRAIIQAVTDYVALRLVEREKALAATEPLRPPHGPAALVEPPPRTAVALARPERPPPGEGAPQALLWFVLGAITGAAGVLAVGYLRARGLAF
jgi:hypothetical protein